MRRYVPVLATLLLALSTVPPAVRAQGSGVVLETKPVELTAHHAGQRDGLRTVHALPESFAIGEHEFSQTRLRGTLTLAVAPGRPPSKRIRGEKILDLKVPTEKGTRKVRVHFRNVDGDRWEYRMAEGRRLEVDKVSIDLIDANADGRIDTSGADVYAWPDSALVLPLTEEILVGATKLTFVEISPDGSEVRARVEPIAGAKDQVAALVLINELRGRNGLPGVELDAELSAACTAHATYLKRNKWSGYTNPHGEVEGQPGYSAEGHSAAQRAIIMRADHASALVAFFTSYYHRAPLIDPYVERVGISTGSHVISVIDAKSGRREVGPEEPWNEPILVPADGSTGFATAFCSSGEQPEPCSNPERRGMPLMALFAAPDHGVTEFRGALVRVDGDDEASVPTIVPAARPYSRMFGLIPAKPLAGGATYRVTYHFTQNGSQETRTATFETR